MADILSKMNQVCLSLQGQQLVLLLRVFVANDSDFKQKFSSWKLASATKPQYFSNDIGGVFNERNLLDVVKWSWQHSEDLYYIVPKDQRMILQNQAWVEGPLKVQGRPMDFSVTEYEKVIDLVSDSKMQQKFKKLPLLVNSLYFNLKKKPHGC